MGLPSCARMGCGTFHFHAPCAAVSFIPRCPLPTGGEHGQDIRGLSRNTRNPLPSLWNCKAKTDIHIYIYYIIIPGQGVQDVQALGKRQNFKHREKKKKYIYICLKTSCWNIKSCEVGTQLSSCLSLNTCSMYVWPWEDAWPSTSWQEKCCHNAEVNNSPALQCSGFLHHKLGLLIWKT